MVVVVVVGVVVVVMVVVIIVIVVVVVVTRSPGHPVTRLFVCTCGAIGFCRIIRLYVWDHWIV